MYRTLPQWQAWQASQTGIARMVWRSRKRGFHAVEQVHITSWGDDAGASVLVALDSASPSQQAALIEPAKVLFQRGYRVIVISSFPAGSLLGEPPQDVKTVERLDHAVGGGLRAVLSVGDYLEMGAHGHRVSRDLGIPYFVVQHGVLTPLAPPLPDGAHLLAWSSADLAFWQDGRATVSGTVCGSQILWQANSAAHSYTHDARSVSFEGVVFLGQLHGLELPRNATRKSVAALRRETQVRYRPHPVETDIMSRFQHRVWERQGVDIAGGGPLGEILQPVLAHFSTGVLEAAAAGVPAYGYCSRPPIWLSQLWDRYEMSPWGADEPTRIVPPSIEPADLVAGLVEVELS
ncbi:MAG: RNA-binding protein [Actinomycetes bacterium]